MLRRASSVPAGPGRWRITRCPRPGTRPSKLLRPARQAPAITLRPARQAPAIGVQSNTSWPCGQDSHPKPECHRRRKCAARREAGVTGVDCGAGDLLERPAIPPTRWARPSLIERSGVLALSLRREPSRGTEGLKTMTHTRQDLAARRRGELSRDRESRRLRSAIDAQRRLNARRALGARAKADPVGPSDARFAYLTRGHD